LNWSFNKNGIEKKVFFLCSEFFAASIVFLLSWVQLFELLFEAQGNDCYSAYY
jgi:hypothetical protein